MRKVVLLVLAATAGCAHVTLEGKLEITPYETAQNEQERKQEVFYGNGEQNASPERY